MSELQADLDSSELKLERRTERYTAAVSELKEKHKEKRRKHKAALAKKDTEREGVRDRAEKRRLAAVSNATRDAEKRLKLSRDACSRHRTSLEVRPLSPLASFPFVFAFSR